MRFNSKDFWPWSLPPSMIFPSNIKKSCSKLHCQKYFKLKPISSKILRARGRTGGSCSRSSSSWSPLNLRLHPGRRARKLPDCKSIFYLSWSQVHLRSWLWVNLFAYPNYTSIFGIQRDLPRLWVYFWLKRWKWTDNRIPWTSSPLNVLRPHPGPRARTHLFL